MFFSLLCNNEKMSSTLSLLNKICIIFVRLVSAIFEVIPLYGTFCLLESFSVEIFNRILKRAQQTEIQIFSQRNCLVLSFFMISVFNLYNSEQYLLESVFPYAQKKPVCKKTRLSCSDG